MTINSGRFEGGIPALRLSPTPKCLFDYYLLARIFLLYSSVYFVRSSFNAWIGLRGRRFD